MRRYILLKDNGSQKTNLNHTNEKINMSFLLWVIYGFVCFVSLNGNTLLRYPCRAANALRV